MKIMRYEDPAGKRSWARREADGSWTALEGELLTGLNETGRPAEVKKILAPLEPRAVIGAALNYKEHARETGKPPPRHPVLFMKLPSAITAPGEPIALPRHLRSGKVDYEGELAVVIGKRCKNARPGNALHHVSGYTCANDVSARDWQYEWGGGQFCRAKTFDTFCPLGPALVTPDEIPDPQNLAIRTVLNGRTVQDSSTADMLFTVAELIAFASGSTTLEPGTVILTGTPPGVGMARTPPLFLKNGDLVSVEIPPVGVLSNPVTEEPQS